MGYTSILGLGCVGASLGVALRRLLPKNADIVGFDVQPGAGRNALKVGAVTRSANRLSAAVEGADLVIVTTPVTVVRDVFEHMAGALPKGCIVTDTASPKEVVMGWAKAILPPETHFIGGHPLLDDSLTDSDTPDPALFEDRTYCLMPAPGASAHALETVVELVKRLGAKPYFIDAAEHDAFAAAQSHLPFLLQCAVLSLTTGSSAWSEMERFVSERYAEACRGVYGHLEADADACFLNGKSMVRWLDECMGTLSHFRDLFAGEEQVGKETFVRALRAAEERLAYKRAEKVSAEIPRAGERLAALFVGERLAGKARRLSKD